MPSVCKAVNPARCRFHGQNYVISQVYKKLLKEGKAGGSYADYTEFISAVLPLVSHAGSRDSYLDDDHDLDGAKQALRMHDYKNGTSLYHSNLPVERILKEVLVVRTRNDVVTGPNLLVKPVEGSSYKPYDHSLALYIAHEGKPVRLDESLYGWVDYDADEHVSSCGVGSVSSVQEDMWQEFNGTFNEDDDHVHGLSGSAVCNCGEFKGKVRVEGNVGDIIKKVLNDYMG